MVSPLTLISDTVKALIPAMEVNKVKRIITLSACGVAKFILDTLESERYIKEFVTLYS